MTISRAAATHRSGAERLQARSEPQGRPLVRYFRMLGYIGMSAGARIYPLLREFDEIGLCRSRG
jgi:hypothetical protein